MKRCPRCGEITDHGPNAARSSGLQSWCRGCLNAAKLERYHGWHAEALADRGPCIDCGSSDALEFDHVDPTTKVAGVTKLWSKRAAWLAEIEKCVVRCHDCHVSRHAA